MIVKTNDIGVIQVDYNAINIPFNGELWKP
jgi:hypothetical protein